MVGAGVAIFSIVVGASFIGGHYRRFPCESFMGRPRDFGGCCVDGHPHGSKAQNDASAAKDHLQKASMHAVTPESSESREKSLL